LQAEIGNSVKVAEAFIDVFEQESRFGFIHVSCGYDQDESPVSLKGQQPCQNPER
jgi:hypothetical protein